MLNFLTIIGVAMVVLLVVIAVLLKSLRDSVEATGRRNAENLVHLIDRFDIQARKGN